MKNISDRTSNATEQVSSPQDAEHGKVVENPWRQLRRFTDARIGLGRAGISLPTAEMLALQLSHAQARDAVHLPLDVTALCQQLIQPQGLMPSTAPILLHSQADDRLTYLQRPDLGRKLDENSRQTLLESMPQLGKDTQTSYDLAIVVVDGLSSVAVQNHAHAVIVQLLELLQAETSPWKLAPLCIVEQGRVAIGDDIAELLNAQLVIVLIGERPGLSSPDSLGLYLTWQPKRGLHDANRNCISNIRPAGLSYSEAAQRAVYLLSEAKRLKLSGVKLKDRTQDNVIEHQASTSNFLTAK